MGFALSPVFAVPIKNMRISADYWRFSSYTDAIQVGEPMSDFRRMLADYRLTTAEILYHMPDHPALLQSFVWQDLDLAPEFPVLNKFLHFWEKKLDGKLHSVKVASAKLIVPAQFIYCKGELLLH